MARLTMFAKGNSDLRDCLIGCRAGGKVVWNGINDVLRVRHPGWNAYVRHETFNRSDALLASSGVVPRNFERAPLPLAAHPAESQFTTRLFDVASDIAVLSIQPDVMNGLVRHREDGHFLHPEAAATWSPADQQRLTREYRAVAPLGPEESMANLAIVVARLRERADPHVLIFNMSPIVPWERIHNYQGLAEDLANRIRRFNLALVELSRRTGISIVDVEAVLAREGAGRLKVDAVHLTPEGCALVADEVVRILADLGCLPDGGPAA